MIGNLSAGNVLIFKRAAKEIQFIYKHIRSKQVYFLFALQKIM